MPDIRALFFLFFITLGNNSSTTIYNSIPRVIDKKTQETQVWSLDQKYPLEEGMATHSSILAWRIPWTEEPGRL